MLPGIEVGGGAGAAGFPFACSLVGTVAAGCGTTKKNQHNHNYFDTKSTINHCNFFYMLRKIEKKNRTIIRMYVYICVLRAFVYVYFCV